MTENRLLRVLDGEVLSPPPVWLMRQAGRYLPEYRELRRQCSNFMDFCLTPELVVRAALQPLERFQLDACILFSDILTIPHALGQEVSFNQAPCLEPLTSEQDILRLPPAESLLEKLRPVAEAVVILRGELAADKALIGFCGAPWTIATYMIGGSMVGGGKDKNFHTVKSFAICHKLAFRALIDKLVDCLVLHLGQQIEAGANPIQIFDSWAGALDIEGFHAWVLEPTRRMVRELRARYPHVKIIGFPKSSDYRRFVEYCHPDGLSIDSATDPRVLRGHLRSAVALQGNLDPSQLAASEESIRASVGFQKEIFTRMPWIANLGHGIAPDTAPEKIECYVDAIRN